MVTRARWCPGICLVASGMKFGVATFVTDESIGPARLWKELEARGFDSVFLAEHSHIPLNRATPYPSGGELPRKYYRTLDPFVALTAMASHTSKLLLGTGIALLPQRDVIHTVKQVASVGRPTRICGQTSSPPKPSYCTTIGFISAATYASHRRLRQRACSLDQTPAGHERGKTKPVIPGPSSDWTTDSGGKPINVIIPRD